MCSLESDSFDMWAKEFLLDADTFLLKEVLLSESCLEFLIIKSIELDEIEKFESFLDDNKNKNLLISSKVIFDVDLDPKWFSTKGFELVAKGHNNSLVMLRKSK